MSNVQKSKHEVSEKCNKVGEKYNVVKKMYKESKKSMPKYKKVRKISKFSCKEIQKLCQRNPKLLDGDDGRHMKDDG